MREEEGKAGNIGGGRNLTALPHAKVRNRFLPRPFILAEVLSFWNYDLKFLILTFMCGLEQY